MEKMKKSKLALALTATLGLSVLAGSAHAINVSNEGRGEFSYIPYFTVASGQEEQIKLVNTSNLTVMTRISFRRGTDSADIRDFIIVLSPYDVWTGTVLPTDANNSNAKIFTTDNSCTVPNKNQWTAENGGYSVAFDKSLFGSNVTVSSKNVTPGYGSSLINPIREGYVMVTVMGVSDIDVNTAGSVPFLAKHINGVPRDCGSIDWAFVASHGAFQSIVSQFSQAEDVLRVSASLVDAAKGTAVDVPVTTLANAFNNGQQSPRLRGTNNITESQVDIPREDQVSPAVSDIFNDRDANLYTSELDGTVAEKPIKAISSVLMNDTLYGTYDTTSGKSSSWIVNFATKRALMQLTDKKPFNDSVVEVGKASYDEEEGTADQSTNFSPFTAPSSFVLPYEVNVVGFGGTNALGSLLNQDAAAGFAKGWAFIGFPKALPITGTVDPTNAGTVAGSKITYTGMPVIGFEFSESSTNGGTVSTSIPLSHEKNLSAN